jgi:hypothetical protein
MRSFNILCLLVLLFSMVSFLLPAPVQAVGDRYFVMGQAVIESGSDGVIAGGSVRGYTNAVDINVTTQGHLNVYVASSTTCNVTTDVATVTESGVALSAGLTTIHVVGTGNIHLNVTPLSGAGNTANWSSHNSWSATSGGACTATEPDSGLDANFDANSFTAASQILTVDVNASTLNMDWTGALNIPTLTHTNTLNIYGNTVFIAAMVMTDSAAAIVLRGSGMTLTMNTLQMKATLYIGIAASVADITLVDALTMGTGRELAVSNGTLDSGNQTLTLNTISDAASTTTKTITLGTSTVNCSAWNFTGTGALTMTDAAYTINVSGTGAFSGNGASYRTVNLNGTAHTVSGSNAFVNLTRNGTATKTDTLTLTSGTTQTVTGTCALIGSSAINRLLVQSSTLGTAATLHVTTDVAANWTGTNAVDFMDITSTHAVDLSAAGLNPAAYSGDCGGNTGLTFTTAAAQTWDGTTGSWSAAAKWTSRVPLPQDDVSAPTTNGTTITVDMPRIGKSVTFTGVGTGIVSLSNDISNYGSFTCVAGMTWTHNNKSLFLRGRGSYNLTSATKDIYFVGAYAPTGTYTLQDALTITNNLQMQGATTFVSGNNNISQRRFADDGLGTLTLGTMTFTCISSSPTPWNYPNTLNANGSTIVLTRADATGITFAGGSKTYNNVTVQGAGAYALTISGNNVFNSLITTGNVSTVSLTGNNTISTLTMNRTYSNKILTLGVGTNTTVSDFVCAKSDGRWLTINATAPATLTKAGGGALGFTYINLAQNTGAPAATWYYTPISVIGAGVTGWILDAPPTVVTIAPSVIGTTTATGRGDVTSLNFGGNINEQGVWYGTYSGPPYSNSSNSTVDVGIGVFTQPLTGLTRSTLYYFRSHATNDDGYAQGAESTFLTKPVEPNTLTTTTVNSTAIRTTWVKGDGASYTYIRYKAGSYPTDVADGFESYNGTGITNIQGGLVDNTVYYFRGWSWFSNTTLSQYSDLYAGNYTITSDEPQLATVAASSVEENTATTTAVITYSNANYTTWGTQYGLSTGYGTWSNVTGISSTIPYAYNNNLAGLIEGSLYYYRPFAVNIVGTGYGTGSTFLTKPDEPTNLSISTAAHLSTLSWTKGSGALNTVIYGRAASYPTLGVGTLVYNGTGSSTTFAPPLGTQVWYYRAWSWTSNSTWSKYSDTYSESNAQGRMSDWVKLLINMTFLSFMVMGLVWVVFATAVKNSIITLMFTLVSFALIAFMGVAIINALL